MKIKFGDISVYLFLLVPLASFILNGMINETLLIIALLLLAILAIGPLSLEEIRNNAVWILYILAIIFSLLSRPKPISFLYEVMVYILMILFLVFSRFGWSTLQKGYRFILVVGIINAIMIFFQFLMRESFNRTVWQLFTPGWQDYVSKYYNYQYFSGIQPVPGDAAGVICFAILILLSVFFVKEMNKRNKNRVLQIIIIVLLLLMQILTGKKGVLFSEIAAIIVMLLLLFSKPKYWTRLLISIGILTVALFAVWHYVQTHSDSTVFYRINKFMTQIISGESYDSGRSLLRDQALLLWRAKPVLGIGWRRFRELTTIIYGYSNMHDVNFDYLQFLCETGIVGFILIMTTLVTMLVRTLFVIKNVLRRNEDPDIIKVVVMSAFIQIFTYFYAFLEIPFYDKMMFFPIYLYSCICISKYYKEIRGKATDPVAVRA